jgi:predicted CXXCH cytochrome family protein
MPRVPGFGPESPIARLAASLQRRIPASRRWRPMTFVVATAHGRGEVAMLAAVQVSSTPQFCGTCHIMKPYYQSWQHSKHNKIACVECHISPGITAEVRKKYEALSMVVKYFTATYGTKPWAEVDDAACLRCHERRLLEGKVMFRDVVFDHTPHLTESRRGLKLRCTSCHSQIVQGTHLTVTVTTCALCHFKGQAPNSGTGECLKCHQTPQHVTNFAGTPFDHSEVSRAGMNCTSCHGGVVRGDGAVAKDRCLSCHNQPDRLARFGDRDFLHRMHVTVHKVDCQNCHSLIEHGVPPRPAGGARAVTVSNPPISTTSGDPGACQSCHGSGHSPQQDLFAGVGGRGVPNMPSVMYSTGVTCQACHDPSFLTRAAASGPEGPLTPPAGAVACMSCHGPTYEGIYDAWKRGVDQRTEALRRELDATAAAMGVEAPQSWEDARWNFQLVSRGHGVHNVNYAYVLLEKSWEQMNAARQAKGLGLLERPWSTVGAGPCQSCHMDMEKQSGTFRGHPFPHGPHLVTAKLGCDSCHRPHAERAPGEIVRFGPEGCMSCHHRAPQVSKDVCGRCHGDVTARTFPSYRGEFSHKQHLEVGVECKDCHSTAAGDPRTQRKACQQCHE